MRRFLIILFFISVLVNIVFKIRRNGRTHHYKEQASLHEYKKITYKEGHKYFENKMTKKHPEINLKSKNSIICFWDSMGFDHLGTQTMRDVDSLAGVFGKYSFNYIFATEMREEQANDFLSRYEQGSDRLTIAGDMDNFISSLYCDYPGKRKMIFAGDTSKKNKCFNRMRHYKMKPYYLILDTAGNVIYYKNGCYLPSKDTAFMRIAKSSIKIKTLQNL